MQCACPHTIGLTLGTAVTAHGPAFHSFIRRVIHSSTLRRANWRPVAQGSRMKRFAILAALMVAAILIFQLAYPSVTIRYRLTLDADVDGKPATGSGVVEVTYRANPRILGASAEYVTEVRGEAVALDLGKQGTLYALLTRGSHVRSSPEDIVPVLFGVTTGGIGPEDFSAIRALSGRRNLPFEFLPALVRFDDQSNPSTAKFASSGLDAKLRSASIEIVDNRVLLVFS